MFQVRLLSINEISEAETDIKKIGDSMADNKAIRVVVYQVIGEKNLIDLGILILGGKLFDFYSKWENLPTYISRQKIKIIAVYVFENAF